MKKIILSILLLFSCNIVAEKKVIVIGGTSGIGKAVALKLAQAGYIVGVAGRREHLLDQF